MQALKPYVPISLVRASRPLRRVVARWRWVRWNRRRFRDEFPVTINEKVQYRMAFDRRPILTLFADKYAVREYVRERVGPEVLTELYAVVERFDDLKLDALPERFVIKPSHGSGAVIIVDDRAPADAVLPPPKHRSEWTSIATRVRKSALLAPEFADICESWLRNRYSPVTEWAYRNVPARLIVEELLDDEGDVPSDYKIYVFNGRVAFVEVFHDRLHGYRLDFFLPEWKQIGESVGSPRCGIRLGPPDSLPTLLRLAAELARGVDFVRVDLYDVSGRVVFGELTNYPAAGNASLYPEALFIELASDWKPWEVVPPQ
jgi:hypothetical protein